MPQMQLTCNIVFEKKDGTNVATCLEMGLVAASDNLADLHATMERLIVRHVSFALQNENFQDIFHPAESEVWMRFKEAFEKSKAREVKKTVEQIETNNWAPVALSQTAYALAC